jgi:hypothetical protein
MAGDEPEQLELEAQMEVATEAIRATVLRLLQEGKVHPQLLILAVPRLPASWVPRRRSRAGKRSRSCWMSLRGSCSKPDEITTKRGKPWRCPWPVAPECACPLSKSVPSHSPGPRPPAEKGQRPSLPQGGEPLARAAQLGFGACRIQAGRRPEHQHKMAPRQPQLGPSDCGLELGEAGPYDGHGSALPAIP